MDKSQVYVEKHNSKKYKEPNRSNVYGQRIGGQNVQVIYTPPKNTQKIGRLEEQTRDLEHYEEMLEKVQLQQHSQISQLEATIKEFERLKKYSTFVEEII